MPESTNPAIAAARANGEAALSRLLRFNEPGRMSLAGAYAQGYGALGMAQIEHDAPDWYDQLDPLDALVLGTAFPQRFADVYEFANTRDRWLDLLRGTVHGKGIEAFVRTAVRASEQFDRPVDDGELMLIIAGLVEDARLDQRKLPRDLLPGVALAGSRAATGPSARAALPPPADNAAERVERFLASVTSELDVPHDGTAADALRQGMSVLARAGIDATSEVAALLPALYLALVAQADELLADAGERAEAWAQGLDDDSPLVPVVDTIRNGAARQLSTADILARLHSLPAFTADVRAQDRRWHSSPGLALPRLAFELGFGQVSTREHTVVKLGEGAAATLRTQRERFEEKFGRPPAPDEPIFFDPAADEPTSIDPLTAEHSSVAWLEALDISPAWIYATQHTGGLLPGLDGNFRNDNDRREWRDALTRYLSTHPGTVVDPNEQLRKLRIGAATSALHTAAGSPSYATSLLERMPLATGTQIDDAYLARIVLDSMATDLLDRLTQSPAVAETAKEFARAWADAHLPAAVDAATTGVVTAETRFAVLLAAFAATNSSGNNDPAGDAVDFNLEASDLCEQLVASILDSRTPDIARDLIESLVKLDDPGEGGRLIALVIAHAIGYLLAMRDLDVTPQQLDAAVTWLGTTFGAAYAGPAAVVSAIAGHPEGRAILADRTVTNDPTVSQLNDLLGIDLFPAMIWLCAALVATAGNNDTAWLRAYRSGD